MTTSCSVYFKAGTVVLLAGEVTADTLQHQSGEIAGLDPDAYPAARTVTPDVALADF